MRTNRLRFDKGVSNLAKNAKGRIGVNPNLLARVGFFLSLKDQVPPTRESYDTDGVEMNRVTLTGDYDPVFYAALAVWADTFGLPEDDDLEGWFMAHMNRGIEIVNRRCKSTAELAHLVAETQ